MSPPALVNHDGDSSQDLFLPARRGHVMSERAVDVSIMSPRRWPECRPAMVSATLSVQIAGLGHLRSKHARYWIGVHGAGGSGEDAARAGPVTPRLPTVELTLAGT
jgi:hypothetical protein